jgi:RNA polymerase sigma-70 factor (ECF subfamily)
VKQAASDDTQLMEQVSAGNVEAFGELYDRFCGRAYGVAYAVCRDEGRAQDAVQEAFLSVWQSRASYCCERGTVSAWLLTGVRYRAIDLARSNGRHSARWASDELPDERAAPEDVSQTVIRRDEARRFHASLEQLPDAQQEVITLAYYGQLSQSEIAAQLGLPPGTVKGRMRLGLQKLRASIEYAA